MSDLRFWNIDGHLLSMGFLGLKRMDLDQEYCEVYDNGDYIDIMPLNDRLPDVRVANYDGKTAFVYLFAADTAHLPSKVVEHINALRNLGFNVETMEIGVVTIADKKNGREVGKAVRVLVDSVLKGE